MALCPGEVRLPVFLIVYGRALDHRLTDGEASWLILTTLGWCGSVFYYPCVVLKYSP